MRKLVMIMLFLTMLPLTVCGQEEIPQSLYLQQDGNRTCTLCSVTMMLRSCIYIHESDDWQQVTEASVGGYAWTSDGLCWDFSYAVADKEFHITQEVCNGITSDELKEVLDAHPEGIVLYCGGSAPHGVFLTGYSGDIFYCADPAWGYAGQRIVLDQSLLGVRHGTQSGILNCVSAYWYIDSHNLEKPSYLSECREYPAEGTIRVRWDGYAMSLPCTQEQCEDTEKLFRIQSGESYQVQAFFLNDAGQGWFCVGDGQYISAEDARRAGEAVQNISQPRIMEKIQIIPLLLSWKIQQKY